MALTKCPDCRYRFSDLASLCPRCGRPAAKATLPYHIYQKERERLSEYEQRSYQEYRKTILTISSASLAFSVSFLGWIHSRGGEISAYWAAVFSWTFFLLSIILVLFLSAVCARSLREEVIVIEEAVQDINALGKANKYIAWEDRLYAVSGTAFVLGVFFFLWLVGPGVHFGQRPSSLQGKGVNAHMTHSDKKDFKVRDPNEEVEKRTPRRIIKPPVLPKKDADQSGDLRKNQSL